MPKKKVETPDLTVIRQTNRVRDFVTTYTDDLEVKSNIYGFAIFFNEFVDKEETGEHEATLFLDQKVKVSMSPEHALALHLVLGDQLEVYQRDHGPIRQSNVVKRALSSDEEGND